MRRLPGMLLILVVVILCFAVFSIIIANKNPNDERSVAVTEEPEPTVERVIMQEIENTDTKNTENAEENSENKTSEPTDQVQPVTENENAENRNRITLMITRDFGKQVLFKEEVTIGPDYTVIDVLQDNIQMTTSFGGSYIKNIEGLESNSGGLSGSPSDWFYYLNGICADVGAGDYILTSGEVVWWDYHEWQSSGLVSSAVIGCYPGPFLQGYHGKVANTIVMSSEDNSDMAMQLEKALNAQGVTWVEAAPFNNDFLEKRTNPTIVIGSWDELKSLEYIKTLNDSYKKTGISAHFADNDLELLDFRGRAVRTISGSAGMIAAVGIGLGDENPLWIIAGTDQAGLQQAIDILINDSQAISGMYCAAVCSGEIIRLPLK